MQNTRLSNALFSAAIIFVMIGCAAGPKDRLPGEPVKVRGSLGTGLTPSSRTLFHQRAISATVTHVAVIPVLGGDVRMGALEKFPILPDGSFEITATPEAGESELLLLINEDATALEDKAVGFAALRSADGADLMAFPLFSAKRDLDFGPLNSIDGSAVSEESLESQGDNFSLSFDQLLETAYRDNLFKHVKNRYINEDARTGQLYSESTSCYFTGNLQSALNVSFSAQSWAHTSGYNTRIDAQGLMDHAYSEVVSGTADIELVPPAALTIKRGPGATIQPVEFSPASPLLVSSMLVAAPEGAVFTFAELTDSSPGSYMMDFDCEETPVNGTWTVNLLKGGLRTKKAFFDLQAASPFTPAPENAFIYYIPSFFVNTDSGDLITSIDIQLHAWNPGTKEYAAVSDLSTFSRLSQGFSTDITKRNGPTIDGEGSAVNAFHFVPEKLWHAGETAIANGTSIDRIDMIYSIAGVIYRFTLFSQP